jgi:hypothetical protein
VNAAKVPAGHLVGVDDEATQYEPEGQITGLTVLAGHEYPAGHGVKIPSWQYFVAIQVSHCHPPRGAAALSTLYVPLLQVQLSALSSVELTGQPHWAGPDDPISEYWEFGHRVV